MEYSKEIVPKNCNSILWLSVLALLLVVYHTTWLVLRKIFQSTCQEIIPVTHHGIIRDAMTIKRIYFLQNCLLMQFEHIVV